MPLVKAQGIVLKMINVGEADKIITLFTDKLGKIQAVAHGSRKAKSKLMASTQVFAYCEYVFYKGKSLYTINQSEIKESFQTILDDLYTLTYCSYLVELMDAVTQYDESNIELFKLFLKTLYLMSGSDADKELVTRAFELKAMSISGYMPDLYRCSVCGQSADQALGFSTEHGGIICGKCSEKGKYSIKVDMPAINVMRYLLKTDIEKIRMVKASETAKKDMRIILKNYIKYYLEREFKSLDFLEQLNNIE